MQFSSFAHKIDKMSYSSIQAHVKSYSEVCTVWKEFSFCNIT